MYYMEQTRYGIWDMLVVWYIYMGIWENHRMWYGMYVLMVWDGKNTVPGIWYDTFAVWYHVTMSWMYFMA